MSEEKKTIFDEQKFQSVKNEFEQRITNLKDLQDLQEKRNNYFFKVKGIFLTFLGIILTISFSSQGNPNSILRINSKFLIALLIIIILTLTRMIYESWFIMRDTEQPMQKTMRGVILANMRYSAMMNPEKMLFYGERSEQLLNQENKIYQAMLNGESVPSIINEFSKRKRWWLEYIYWSILFIAVPILFLVRIVNIW